MINSESIPPCVRSFVAIPLRMQERIVGVINVSHTQAYAFSPHDVRLLSSLAEQIAITMERLEIATTLETLVHH